MKTARPSTAASAARSGGVAGHAARDLARKGRRSRRAEVALASVAAAGAASGAAGLLALALGQPPAIYLCPLAVGAALARGRRVAGGAAGRGRHCRQPGQEAR